MIPQKLAKPSEFSLAGVLQTKLECLQSRTLIHDFKAGVIAKDVKDGTIGLP